MDDQLLHDKIEQYLLGEMPLKEKALLETEIASDPRLADQVALQRIALMGLDRLAGRDLRQKFDAWDDEPEGVPPQPPTARWKWSAISLVLLLASGIFWYFSQIRPVLKAKEAEQSDVIRRDSLIKALEAESNRKQDILNTLLQQGQTGSDTSAQSEIRRLRRELEQMENTIREQEKNGGQRPRPMAYAAPSAPSFGERGSSEGVFKNAVTLFDKGRYAEAERLLKSIPPSEEAGQRNVALVLPYALFYGRKYGEAADAFAKLRALDKFEAPKAEWYQALAYANDDRKAFALQLLAEIVKNERHPFYADALVLQKQLNK